MEFAGSGIIGEIFVYSDVVECAMRCFDSSSINLFGDALFEKIFADYDAVGRFARYDSIFSFRRVILARRFSAFSGEKSPDVGE